MTADALSSVDTLPAGVPPDLPSVGVIVPTRSRPELLRQCLASIVAQDYAGVVEIAVVFDGEDPDTGLRQEFGTADRPVRVLTNTRTPGLAGARNSGLEVLDTSLIGFCDDDDAWAPGKLRAQVQRLVDAPAAELATCAIVISYDGRRSARLAGRDQVEYRDLLSSRLAMLHSSTFLFRRGALVDGIGPPDESIPGSQNEDWDLLLRAAARHPIAHVDEPLVDVLWGQSSYFSRQWETRVTSLLWMLRRHPLITSDRTGAARVYGQLAFGYAVLGERREALRWAVRSLRRRWREPRGPIALAVTVRLVSGEWVLARLHRHGHGI